MNILNNTQCLNTPVDNTCCNKNGDAVPLVSGFDNCCSPDTHCTSISSFSLTARMVDTATAILLFLIKLSELTAAWRLLESVRMVAGKTFPNNSLKICLKYFTFPWAFNEASASPVRILDVGICSLQLCHSITFIVLFLPLMKQMSAVTVSVSLIIYLYLYI